VCCDVSERSSSLDGVEPVLFRVALDDTPVMPNYLTVSTISFSQIRGIVSQSSKLRVFFGIVIDVN
jgi:hypothetical protein